MAGEETDEARVLKAARPGFSQEDVQTERHDHP
jgi:hypothetical protein